MRKQLEVFAIANDYFILGALLLFTILLFLKLDGSISSSYCALFLPLWAACCTTLAYLSTFTYHYRHFKDILYQGAQSLQLKIFYDMKPSSSYIALSFIFSTFTSRTGRILTWISFGLIFLWLFILPLELDYRIFSIQLAVFPLLALNVMCAVLPLIFAFLNRSQLDEQNPSKFAVGVVLVLSGMCFSVFGILVWNNLHSQELAQSWLKTLAPLFVLEILAFVGSFGYLFFLRRFRTFSAKLLATCWCCGWWFVIPLLLSFQILLAMKLDKVHEESYATVFAPLLVDEFVLLVWTFFLQVGSNAALSQQR